MPKPETTGALSLLTAAAALALVLILGPGTGRSGETASSEGENSWEALPDEPSRAALFKAYAQQKMNRPRETQTFALPAAFAFPQDASFDQASRNAPRTAERFGLDISHYEPNFPLAKLKDAGAAFIYMKATQGTRYKDSTFAQNWRFMNHLPEENRIPKGAYHFLAAGESGAAQAARFVDYVTLQGGIRQDDLPPALDFEWDKACPTCPDRWRGRDPDDIVKTALDFLKTAEERTGRRPLLYTNKSFLDSLGITGTRAEKLTGNYKLWIFDLDNKDRRIEIPNPDKNLNFTLWQFSFRGELTGLYDRPFDVSVFKGSDKDFRAALLAKASPTHEARWQ